MSTALLSPLTSKFKVLVVDDSIDNLRFLANILSRQGCQVRKVLNGHMALTAAKSAPPDLVLLDINMPQMNGYEVCQALKADPLTADIPVIFISALEDVLDRVRAYTVGGVDYLAKPFQYEEVMARVNTQLQLQAIKQDAAAQAEQATLAEASYTQLFNQMGQGAYHLHLDGRYHQVNRAFAQMLGYASTATLLEQVGQSPQALYVDPEYWLNMMEQVCDGQPLVEQVADLYCADGAVVTVSENLHPVGESSTDAYYYLGLVSAIAATATPEL